MKRSILLRAGALASSMWMLWAGSVQSAPVTNPNEVPVEKVCKSTPTGDYALSQPDFLWWMVGNFNISRECSADADRRENNDTRLAVLLGTSDGKRCEKDADKINAARDLVLSMLSNRSSRFRSDIPLQPRLPRSEIIQRFPTAVVTCEAPEKKADEKAVDNSFHVSDLKIGPWRAKLRLDQGSLEADRGTDDYKKAKSAKFSIADDGLKSETRFDVKAAIGLDSGFLNCAADSQCRLIPYIKWDKGFTKPKPAKSDADKFAVGLIGIGYLLDSGPVNSVLSLDGQYILDESAATHTEIVAGTLRWKPSIRIGESSIPGGQVKIANVLYAGYEYGGVLRFGKALDAGGSVAFQREKDFVYYGPELDVWFLGAKEGPLENFKLTLHYNYLWSAQATYDRLPFFSAELSYTLDKEGDVDISITYERGREYETFEERSLLKTSLGYKF